MSLQIKAGTLQIVAIVLIVCGIIAGIAVAAVVVNDNGSNKGAVGGNTNNNDNPNRCIYSCPDCPQNVTLPPSEKLPLPKSVENAPPWYIDTNILTRAPMTYTTTAIRVDYVPYKWGSGSGAEFRANPDQMLPSQSAVMNYSVYFPPDFPWMRGGKLPGVCIGNSSVATECATGSNWGWSTGSVRLMWRNNGNVIAYVYFPLQIGGIGGGYNAAIMAQGVGYREVARGDGYTGDDLFCSAKGGLKFQAGVWNNITLVVVMSSIGKADGVISLTVNGETRTVKDVFWSTEKDVTITKYLFATFFGGNDISWAIQNPTYALFNNFTFAAPANMSASTILSTS